MLSMLELNQWWFESTSGWTHKCYTPNNFHKNKIKHNRNDNSYSPRSTRSLNIHDWPAATNIKPKQFVSIYLSLESKHRKDGSLRSWESVVIGEKARSKWLIRKSFSKNNPGNYWDQKKTIRFASSRRKDRPC